MIIAVAAAASGCAIPRLSSSSLYCARAARLGGVAAVRAELATPFLGDRRSCRRRRLPARARRRRTGGGGGMAAVNEVAGQYEDAFDDIDVALVNFFTYKAVRTVLHQLYEMNPPSYKWFYNFVADNKASEGNRFLRALSKERQELAERVMVTRLHLYGKWIKKCDHAKMYQRISDENLQLMRERLMEIVVWPSDDSNTTEKIG